jgi:membrane protein implicated in regulation of membrane protease activity
MTVPLSIGVLSPTLLWVVAGAILCLMEFFFPTAFIEFMMGLSALLVAVVSLFVPSFSAQVALWLLFSTLLVMLSRRFLSPKRQISLRGEAREGETITAIPPGEAGRVLYEGNSWRAKCGDEERAIAPNEKVYIIGREGNTLIVMPQNILHS